MRNKKAFAFGLAVVSTILLASCSFVKGENLASGKEEESTSEAINTEKIKIALGSKEVFDNVGYVSCIAEITPSNATDKDIVWTTNNTAISYQYGYLIISKVAEEVDVLITATYKNNPLIFAKETIKVKPFIYLKDYNEFLKKGAVRVKTSYSGQTTQEFAIIKNLKFEYAYDTYCRFSEQTNVIAKVKIVKSDYLESYAGQYTEFTKVIVKLLDNKTSEAVTSFVQTELIVYRTTEEEYEMSFSFSTQYNEYGYSLSIIGSN